MSLRLTAISTALWISSTTQAERADRPNVIVIMADDIGAEGLACYGSTIYTTPNLDRMAAEGLRFGNAYATPLCTPTRVMIMSGLYPAHRFPRPHRQGRRRPDARKHPNLRA